MGNLNSSDQPQMTSRVLQHLRVGVEGVKDEMKPECGVDVVGISPI
jgi:hypothetical protein